MRNNFLIIYITDRRCDILRYFRESPYKQPCRIAGPIYDLFAKITIRYDVARGRRENAVAAKYLRTQIKATFVHKESSTRATLKRNIAIEWCAKTHLHKCSGRYAAFILQRGVHRRANTLSRHKYLVGEQGRSLNPGGERRSAGRRLHVHTSRRSMVFDDPISWLSRGGRWTDGRGVGVRAYRTFKSRTRVTVIYMDGGLANLPYASLCVRCSARFVTSTSMPITPSESYSAASRERKWNVPPQSRQINYRDRTSI